MLERLFKPMELFKYRGGLQAQGENDGESILGSAPLQVPDKYVFLLKSSRL